MMYRSFVFFISRFHLLLYSVPSLQHGIVLSQTLVSSEPNPVSSLPNPTCWCSLRTKVVAEYSGCFWTPFPKTGSLFLLCRFLILRSINWRQWRLLWPKRRGNCTFSEGLQKTYVMVYSAATNSWRIGKCSMNTAGRFFTSAAIGGKVFAFSGDDGLPGDDSEFEVQCYDPVLDSSVSMARRKCTVTRYDVAVIGRKIYITEGFSWPFEEKPYGSIYDTESNTWLDMPLGMRLGWTSSAATLGPDLFVFSHNGNRKAKVYNHVTDSWMQVKGSGIPELVKEPYTVTADDENRKIYVVGSGLNVAIATLIEVEMKKWEIEWDVVKGPEAFSQFHHPRDSRILYA